MSAQLPRYITQKSDPYGLITDAANLVQSVSLCFPIFSSDKQGFKKEPSTK